MRRSSKEGTATDRKCELLWEDQQVFHRLLYVGLVCGLGLVLVGCSGSDLDLAEVKGKVTYNSAPVADAVVTFLPGDGPIATGVTDANGEFTLTTNGEPGAVIGEHGVSIAKTAASAEGVSEDMTSEDYEKMMSKPGASLEAVTGGEGKSEIPAKYAVPETSGLTKTVSSDTSANECDFVLTD